MNYKNLPTAQIQQLAEAQDRNAFMRIYGVDIKKAGALSTVYLDVKQI